MRRRLQGRLWRDLGLDIEAVRRLLG